MKKLEKLSLRKLQDEIDLIGIDEANQLKGMGSFTGVQMESMMSNGTWTGGQVDGMGYVSATVDVVVEGKVTSTCSLCTSLTNSATYGGVGSAGYMGQAMLNLEYFFHSLGWHESWIIYDTIYFKK